MVLLPIDEGQDRPPDYLTLSEVLAVDLIKITEVNAGGSVPNLRVDSRARKPILMLEGEKVVVAIVHKYKPVEILAGGSL